MIQVGDYKITEEMSKEYELYIAEFIEYLDELMFNIPTVKPVIFESGKPIAFTCL